MFLDEKAVLKYFCIFERKKENNTVKDYALFSNRKKNNILKSNLKKFSIEQLGD